MRQIVHRIVHGIGQPQSYDASVHAQADFSLVSLNPVFPTPSHDSCTPPDPNIHPGFEPGTTKEPSIRVQFRVQFNARF
jgi:hypothetical protein